MSYQISFGNIYMYNVSELKKKKRKCVFRLYFIQKYLHLKSMWTKEKSDQMCFQILFNSEICTFKMGIKENVK